MIGFKLFPRSGQYGVVDYNKDSNEVYVRDGMHMWDTCARPHVRFLVMYSELTVEKRA